VTFAVAAEAYDRFMGRYSMLLSPQMADLADVAPGQRVLDVGCGPGALTSELVARVGADHVAAVDPSASFVDAAGERNPGVDVRLANAELLPFPNGRFDAAIAQLVVHFMTEPVRGISEMARVVRPDGVVAACVWDHAGGQGPLGLFWEVARSLDPQVEDESNLAGTREGHLAGLFEKAGLDNVESTIVSADLRLPSFDAWWEPFTAGVGPAGDYVARLSPDRRAELRERCRSALPGGAFTLPARAWAARGVVARP
jgi:SAM-dependent methyltransferase